MDKSDYIKRSQELQLPLKCPIVGYCQRWVLSIYLISYDGYGQEPNNGEKIDEFLKRKGELPPDFDDRRMRINRIKMCAEYPGRYSSDELGYGTNLCPEITLFDGRHCLGILPREAISSYEWSKSKGVSNIEHKHFSECREFIKYKDRQQFEAKTMVENRTINTSGGDYQENNLQDNFGIGVNQGEISGNAKIGGVINEEQRQDLAEAAKEIQGLLDQLSQSYPSETKKEKRIFTAQAINLIEENPSLTQKLLSAVKAGSVAALESMLNHPAASFVIAALEDLEEN